MVKQNKILITGGDGFLGRHVGEILKDCHIKFKKTSRKDLDIINKDEVKKGLKNIDIVIHLAGNIRTKSSDDAESNFTVNSTGTLNILEAARINKIKKIILASTVEVYANQLSASCISESDLCAPTSYYGQSKLLAENYCLQYAKKFGIDCLILRFTYLYGEGMHKTRIVSRMIKAAKNKQEIVIESGKSDYFDLLYVKDAARAVVLALNNIRTKEAILNISSNKTTNIKEIAKIIKKNNPSFKVKYKEKTNYYPAHYYDNKRAEKILKFKPQYSLAAGLKDFVDKNSQFSV